MYVSCVSHLCFLHLQENLILVLRRHWLRARLQRTCSKYYVLIDRHLFGSNDQGKVSAHVFIYIFILDFALRPSDFP